MNKYYVEKYGKILLETTDEEEANGISKLMQAKVLESAIDLRDKDTVIVELSKETLDSLTEILDVLYKDKTYSSTHFNTNELINLVSKFRVIYRKQGWDIE